MTSKLELKRRFIRQWIDISNLVLLAVFVGVAADDIQTWLPWTALALLTLSLVGQCVRSFVRCIAESRRLARMMHVKMWRLPLTLVLAGFFCLNTQAQSPLLDENGLPQRDNSGNVLLVFRSPLTGSVILARDSQGNIVQPNLTACELLVAAGVVVIAAGAYVGVKLKQCAHRNLYPTNVPPPLIPTNTIPTNNPATNKPPRGSVELTQYDASVASSNWFDPYGNPIECAYYGRAFEFTSDTATNRFMSSPDLIHWTAEPLTFVTWWSLSETGVNLLTVTYDQFDRPCGTSFCVSGQVVFSGFTPPQHGRDVYFYAVMPTP